MRTSKNYSNELYQQFRYLATWLPGTPLALGDIGVLKNNEFTKISNLSNEGIKFDELKDETKSDIDYSSKGAVSITTKASGVLAPQSSVLGEVDAGITVEFSKENAILFKANETLSPSIKDQITLGKEILKRFKDGKWDKDWAVITELVVAKSGTILISSSSSGKIELKAKGKVEAAKLDIADAGLGFELSFSKDLATKIIAQESITPLFKASKIKGRLLQPRVFGMKKVRLMDLVTPEKARSTNDLIYFGEADFENTDDE